MILTYGVKFNTSTGHDTTASGMGTTNVSGTSASYSGSVFTLDGSPNISDVESNPGDYLIWVQTSTGRQFFTVSSASDSGDTVTVNETPAGTTSGLTWGIGGERNDLDTADNRTLFTLADGMSDGWEVILETNQTLSSLLRLTTAATLISGVRMRSSVEGTTRVINQTSNTPVFQNSDENNSFVLQDLTLTNSNGTSKTSAYGYQSSGGNQVSICCVRVIFGDPSDTNNLKHGLIRSGNNIYGEFFDCAFINCDSDGVKNYFYHGVFQNCAFLDNGGMGFNNIGSTSTRRVSFHNCIFAGNTGDGMGSSGTWAGNYYISGCTFHNNGGDGLDVSGFAAAVKVSLYVFNNQFTDNAGYGVRGDTEVETSIVLFDGNNYGADSLVNTLGDTLTLTKGSNDVAVDPAYVDAANHDYEVTAAGVKSVGIPIGGTDTLGAGQTSTDSYIDIGASQAAAGAGAASGARNPFIGPIG